MKKFEEDYFVIQLMAKGSYVDNSNGSDCLYLVEAFTIRLNHIALNAWILSAMFNTRDCYETDEEWETHKAEYKTRREAFNKQIIEALEIEPSAGSVSITQAQSEVFTVVHIRKIS